MQKLPTYTYIRNIRKFKRGIRDLCTLNNLAVQTADGVWNSNEVSHFADKVVSRKCCKV